MSGDYTDLIQRLRATAEHWRGMGVRAGADLLTEAADALEAAHAERDVVTAALLGSLADARAERDAEAALADRFAAAVTALHDDHPFARATLMFELASHRERVTARAARTQENSR